ncbi:MAG: branched-chain amino acid ABC transporter permease [Chloroflexota bacterium]|nr:branched-chain amino acid ABC transporter permease [Chloroflexota bacterium]
MATATLAAGERFDAREERREARRRALWTTAAVGFMALYPFLDRALGINRLGSWMQIFVFVILAMGLNIVVGYAGLLDLGYAAFFAIGAYTNAFLTSPTSYFVRAGWVPDWLQHFWPAMALSWAVAAVFGVLLGAPTLRLRGDYLAIVTLGFGEIVPVFFLNATTVTGGTKGINPIGAPPAISAFGGDIRFSATDQRNWYWLMLGVGLLTVFLVRRLHDSRLGRSWMAIREDEIAAASMGINLVRTKLWAFALGASFSGFAGAVYAAAFQYVHPEQFRFSVSVMILAMVILGGLGNIYGVILGGLVIGSFDRILVEVLNEPFQRLVDLLNLPVLQDHNLAQDRFLVFGLALVLMMLLRPGGLVPNARRKAEMKPETEDERVLESQQLYDIRQRQDPAAGERA